MAGGALSWSALQPSRERRVWLCFAGALSLGLATAFGIRALADAALIQFGAALVCALAAVLVHRALRRPVPPAALAIDADGRFWVRHDADDAPLPAWPRLVADRLVTLQSPGALLVVWRDALAPTQFRRLCAYARWHVVREGARPLAAEQQPNAGI